MSAIGVASGATKSGVIGARAEFRRSDYYFPRTQSSAMRDLPWADRTKPIRSWDRMAAFAAVAVTIGALAVNVI
jgi:hypothetical protein